TMAFEAKLPAEELPELLQSLSPKVEWYPRQSYVWVKNFVKKQAKSPKFLIAAAKALKNINNNGMVKEIVEYNLKEYGISIPYEYGIDKLSISPDDIEIPPDGVAVPSASDTDTGTDTVNEDKEKGVIKGGEEAVGAMVNMLAGLKGWSVDEEDIDWLRDFCKEFPDFSSKELRACADYHSGRSPPKHKGIWKNRFRNWMVKKREFKEKNKGEQAKGRRIPGARPPSDFRGNW
ncbi:MAG: hypothetical protein PHN78_09055, partial [Dehalococcoidales bacterium]|nr:hypothetical protein [Dehalococcoidales bacterium]